MDDEELDTRLKSLDRRDQAPDQLERAVWTKLAIEGQGGAKGTILSLTGLAIAFTRLEGGAMSLSVATIVIAALAGFAAAGALHPVDQHQSIAGAGWFASAGLSAPSTVLGQ